MIPKIYRKLENEFNFLLLVISTHLKLYFNKQKTIYLFGCPIHPNLGDQAQTYCLENWIAINFPDYKLVEFSWRISTPRLLARLKKTIKQDDLIFGHSGYFFFEPHRELPVYRKVAELFPTNKFIIFPQTINLTDPKILERTSAVLNSHQDLTLICRDEISYSNAKKQFADCKLLLYPDIVTSLIGRFNFSGKRSGVLFCLRNDMEAYYQKHELNQLMDRFRYLESIESMDTTIAMSYWELKKNRKSILENTFKRFSSFKLVITDRYHGAIFSLIGNTPVIVISSSDHKLSSGVKWFPKSFVDYVNYAENLDEAYAIGEKILNNPPKKKLPSFFEENYYSKLKPELL
jgi:exopolysaccharide biosynthesis predicted pyruvyltransferase EpsI